MVTGTVTITEQTHKMVKKVTFDWDCTTGTVANKTTDNSYDGEVLRIVNLANTSTGTWNLQIHDSDGVDLLGGQGSAMTSGSADFGTSTGGSKNYPLSVVSSELTLDISSATTGSSGTTIVYIR